MFKPYAQNQNQLLPRSFEESIAPDHLARLISHSVDELDISAILNLYSQNGQHAYHPRLLLKVLMYGYASGIRSSRKLADKLNEDIVFMWLSGRQTPDFRKDKLADFKTLFAQVIKTCMNIGLVRVGAISLDGSKILASASKNKMQCRRQLSKRKINLQEKIDQIIREADELDAEEDKLYGSHTINETGVVITREKVAKAMKKITRRRQTIKKNQGSVKSETFRHQNQGENYEKRPQFICFH